MFDNYQPFVDAVDDLLSAFNKRTDLGKIERAVKLLRERDIDVVTYLLIGGVTKAADYEAPVSTSRSCRRASCRW